MDSDALNSDRLDMLLAIVSQGSFSGAGRVLGLTQSAVSMAVADLEADLGLTLFDRSGRSAVPTATLQALLPDARLVSERLQLMRAHLRDLASGAEGQLRVGMSANVDPRPVLAALSQVERKFPSVEVSLMVRAQADVVAALHQGAIDACVAFGEVNFHALETIEDLWAENILAVVAPSHPLAGQEGSGLIIEDLMHHRQIVVGSASASSDDRRALIGSRRWQAESLQVAVRMVQQGLGWANLPQSLIGDALAAGSLVPLAFANIHNGLAMPVYLRQIARRRRGETFGAFKKALLAHCKPAARRKD